YRPIHDDFRKILLDRDSDEILRALEEAVFGEATPASDARMAFRVDSAYQGSEALALVQRSLEEHQPYSVAFVDMRMPPGWDGLNTIERVWAVDPHIQTVICSAYSDHDWEELTARLGRSDKLLVVKKPFDPVEVLQCAHALAAKWENERTLARHVSSLKEDVSDRTARLEAANKQLRHLATHDALTGLPNRVLLEDRMHRAIEQAKRTGGGFAVCVIDLDRFKLINDSLGHHAGDTLLKHVARCLKSTLRTVDTAVRFGGDEFVLILDGARSKGETDRVTRAITEALNVTVRIGEHEIHTSASIGLAFYPADGTTIETLSAHADAAMYSAKKRGGIAVEYYASGMELASEDRVKLEADLHRALQRQQFALHYQPKFNSGLRRIHSAEALIRWRHPERGLVSPDRFIPLAEESGLIVPIGEWVLHEACRQVRAWQDQGLPALRLAVNISGVQFRRVDLVDTVEHALREAAIDARSLEIELTETAVMSDPEESVDTLQRLSRMGVIVSVDDFGTGYSSMSYLRRFPIDKLKIDRSFIANVLTSTDDAAIVQAIISLAHSLRLKVVAEGVESAEQLQFLQKHGCDHYQGYYFSKPVDAGTFTEMLRTSAALDNEPPDDPASRTYSRLAIVGR
ncbi:MAG TPA: EAL domain-containing protein, partial [Steroidobacteraceae bacterium]